MFRFRQFIAYIEREKKKPNVPVPQDRCPTHAKGQPGNARGQMTTMQVMGYPFVEEPPFVRDVRQKTHTPSEPTEHEKLSHDSLLGEIGS